MEKILSSLYYIIVRLIAKVAIYLFYHPIEVNGLENIPKNSSRIIFAPNHQSAFLDAILVAVFSTKPIYFLTRADIFTFPFKYALRSLNMMPVYRLRDGRKTMSKNEGVFETCKNLVQSGKPILLFPEASQKLVHYLRPLSKGLSRIALLSQKDFDHKVYIIPVGINYFDHLNGGSKLILNYGKAIDLKQIVDGSESEQQVINEIRDKTTDELIDNMFIPHNDEHYQRNLKFLNKHYYKYKFSDFKAILKSGEDPKAFTPSKIMYILFAISLVPNLTYKLVEWFVIKYLIEDKTFYASIRVGLLMFAFPIHLIFWFILISSWKGIPLAILTLLIQIIMHLFNQRLIKHTL